MYGGLRLNWQWWLLCKLWQDGGNQLAVLYFPAKTTLVAKVRFAALLHQSDELPSSSSQSFGSKMSNWQKKFQALLFTIGCVSQVTVDCDRRIFQGFENLNEVHRRKDSVYIIWKSCAIDGIHTCSYILLLCNHWRSGQFSRWRWTTKSNLSRDIITAATSWINLTLCFES